jgi:hypothetical protein
MGVADPRADGGGAVSGHPDPTPKLDQLRYRHETRGVAKRQHSKDRRGVLSGISRCPEIHASVHSEIQKSAHQGCRNYSLSLSPSLSLSLSAAHHGCLWEGFHTESPTRIRQFDPSIHRCVSWTHDGSQPPPACVPLCAWCSDAWCSVLRALMLGALMLDASPLGTLLRIPRRPQTMLGFSRRMRGLGGRRRQSHVR